MNIWRFPYFINKPSLVHIRLQLFKWDHFHIFSLSYNLTSDNLWPHEHMKVPILYQWAKFFPIRLQLFKWGHFYNFTLSYNLTSDDLWPWYVTFDLINKWGFPCCIYDPTLVEIHQSMWNSGQSDPYVSFLLRQATQKQIKKKTNKQTNKTKANKNKNKNKKKQNKKKNNQDGITSKTRSATLLYI